MSNKTLNRIPFEQRSDYVAKKYTPRNDFVIVRRVRLDLTPGGVAVSDQASEAYEHFVEAVGPKVEHLKKGDKILALLVDGEAQNYVIIPNERNLLFAVRESTIMMTVEESGSNGEA